MPSHPPRLSEVEFSGPTRTIRMPMRGAIPVLTRAIRVEDAHPSVGLLSGATLLAMKLVAAGRVRLSESGDSWRVGPLHPEDDDRLHALARARAHADTTVEEAEDLIRQLLDAVVDTVTRPPPAPITPGRGGSDRRGPDQAGHREDRDDESDLPDAVRITLRVEAPTEVLEGGGVVVVLQAHEADDDTHVVDADQLWLGEGHGFSRRARVNVSVALRQAARIWAPLDRLQRQQVPDRMVLDADELSDLLEHGLEALDRAGVDVFWPRGLRGELIPQARVDVASGPREGQLYEGLFGPGALFEFDWKLALGDDALTDDEMATLASATTPVIRLRDNWMIIDPVVARRARKRKAAQKIKPVVALQSALTGIIDLDGEPVEVHAGASLLKVRDRIVDAATVAPLPAPA
ncbi:MAG: SNF2 helicase-associated domain-containing protein, partial [Nocardioides sp.]